MREILETDQFIKEVAKFPSEVHEKIIELLLQFLCGEQLPATSFKTFKVGTGVKVQEFKVKDRQGNWRAISCFMGSDKVVLLYAFHKKSQKLLDRDKKIIINRIRRMKDGY